MQGKEVWASIFSFMGTMTTSSTLPVPQEVSNFDEVSMQQSLLFSDSLKVLLLLLYTSSIGNQACISSLFKLYDL